MSLRILRYLGLAEEDDFNPVSPPAAVFHMDIASASLDAPTDTELLYAGGLGRGQRIRRPGFYAPAGNIVYAADVATIGWLLKWALGGYAFTGGDPNRHEIYGVNDTLLPSFTARLGKDIFEHVFAGCVVNSLEIAIDEWCMVTVDVQAATDSQTTIKAVAALDLPAGHQLAWHDAEMTIAAENESAIIKRLTLTIGNNISADAGRNLASRHPARILAGERDITFGMDLFFADTEELERFWGDSSGPDEDGASQFASVITITAEDDHEIEISLPNAFYTQAAQQPSGRAELVQAVEARAMIDDISLEAGGTVESEILVSILNDIESMEAVS